MAINRLTRAPESLGNFRNSVALGKQQEDGLIQRLQCCCLFGYLPYQHLQFIRWCLADLVWHFDEGIEARECLVLVIIRDQFILSDLTNPRVIIANAFEFLLGSSDSCLDLKPHFVLQVVQLAGSIGDPEVVKSLSTNLGNRWVSSQAIYLVNMAIPSQFDYRQIALS